MYVDERLPLLFESERLRLNGRHPIHRNRPDVPARQISNTEKAPGTLVQEPGSMKSRM